MALQAVRILTSALLLAAASLLAQQRPDSRLSEPQRIAILREFAFSRPYASILYPRGKQGLRLVHGALAPRNAQLLQLAESNGVAARPGDMVVVTAVHFLHRGIVFEINGGPVKRKKWYENIELAAGDAPSTSIGEMTDKASAAADEAAKSQNNDYANQDKLYVKNAGSYVYLGFDGPVPSLEPAELKTLLAPALDYFAHTPAEAYARALPPKLAAIVAAHKPLVGMSLEMALRACGKPDRRLHDRDPNGAEYEEWIYGAPPQSVRFLRFYTNRLRRIVELDAQGARTERTADELAAYTGEPSFPVVAERPSILYGDRERSAPPSLRGADAQPTPSDPSAPK